MNTKGLINEIFRIVFITILFIGLVSGKSKSNKPVFMVLPASSYCIENGYILNEDSLKLDYKLALENDKLLIQFVDYVQKTLMNRGLPIVNVLNQQEDLQNLINSTDYIVGLNYYLRSGKLRMQIDLLDCYWDEESIEPVYREIEIKEENSDYFIDLVGDCMDEFNGKLMNYFTGMFEKGKFVKIVIKGELINQNENGNSFQELFLSYIEQNSQKNQYEILTQANKELVVKFNLPMYYLKKGKQFTNSPELFAQRMISYFRNQPSKTKLELMSSSKREIILGIN